jgi:hypothetical protein
MKEWNNPQSVLKKENEMKMRSDKNDVVTDINSSRFFVDPHECNPGKKHRHQRWAEKKTRKQNRDFRDTFRDE